MKCRICEVRKPRRYCPGVRADICSLCCGAEREETVDCPLDCEYLREARQHEKPHAVDELPNKDIRLSEEFLREHDALLVFLGAQILEPALTTPGVVDSDVREALECLIRTYRTLQSGLYYETLPTNPLAAGIHQSVQAGIEKLRKELSERGDPPIRDAAILGMLAFFERVLLHQNNGRKRGRAFIDYLRAYFPPDRQRPANAPSLIQV